MYINFVLFIDQIFQITKIQLSVMISEKLHLCDSSDTMFVSEFPPHRGQRYIQALMYPADRIYCARFVIRKWLKTDSDVSLPSRILMIASGL